VKGFCHFPSDGFLATITVLAGVCAWSLCFEGAASPGDMFFLPLAEPALLILGRLDESAWVVVAHLLGMMVLCLPLAGYGWIVFVLMKRFCRKVAQKAVLVVAAASLLAWVLHLVVPSMS